MAKSNRQMRVVDPVLSSIALGYSNPMFIAQELFPMVDCPTRGVKVIRFGKEAFIRHQSRRSPGADTERVMFGFEDSAVKLYQESLEAVVPREWLEESQNTPNVDISTRSVNIVMENMALGLEIDAADIAQNPANYGANNKEVLALADRWGNPTVDIRAQTTDWRDKVRQQIGRDPNVLELPYKVYEAAKRNDLVREQFKYTTSESITAEMLANFFEVEKVIVGKSLKAAPDGQTLEDIWSSIVMAYVPPEAIRNMAVPSYGYTYRLRNHPMVETSYFDNRAKSHIHPVTDERSPELTGMEAGYLVESPI